MTNKILNEIKKIDNLAELNALSTYVMRCKTNLGKATIKVGSKVNIVQKTKKTAGVVTKVMVKKAIVETTENRFSSYRVPLAMLELA
mgnify:CR=1 FL=1|jgi:hypothetical protein|tara:strand:+ start:178 stop:438 length:261 start_codon:yes stop_codon:yes gene_type:complete